MQVYVSADLSKHCAVYPTPQFASYLACDRAYGLEVLAAIFGPGFTPLAYSDNLTTVTATPTFGRDITVHQNLVSGRKLSNCRLPCTITKTKTKHLGDQDYKQQGLRVEFKKDMGVRTTSLVPFSASKLLTEVGGVLGLWLGLGTVQLLELVYRLPVSLAALGRQG